MQLRVIIRTSWNPPEPPVFGSAFLHTRPPWGSLLGSSLGHLVVIASLPALSGLLGLLQPSNAFLAKYDVEPLRLRVPEVIFYSSKTIEHPKLTAPSPAAPKPAAAPASSAAAPSRPAEARRPTSSATVRKGVELPAARQTDLSAAILLQPDFQPAAPRTDTLPPLSIWARQSAVRPPPKPFIVPGSGETNASIPQLDAPPVIAIPNRQANVSDLNVAMPDAPQPLQPALPVPNSTTVPIREKNNQTQAGAIGHQDGDPGNIISVSSNRVPPGQVINVPRGARNLPAAGQQDATAAAGEKTAAEPSKPASNTTSTDPPAATTAAGAARGTAKSAPSTATTPDAPATAARNAARNGSATTNPATTTTPATTSATTTPPANAPPSTANSTAPASAAAGATNQPATPANRSPGNAATTPAASRTAASSNAIAPPAPAPGVIQINHPVNGNFDVVITQSTPSSDSPDVDNLLTGNPIYTVYLRVGDNKEWLLEYCVPNRQNNPNNPYQVFLPDSTPVAPPYPISTSIPEDVLRISHTKEIVFHGYLTANGSFRDLVARDPGNQLAREIASLLSQWRFRPPTKDRVPVEIEVVLVVPKSL